MPPTPAGPALARLSVDDTGEGFDPAQAPQLFERFYRADTARADTADTAAGRGGEAGSHGSGIGLTITRGIVLAHHGDITAHSAGAGEGASFAITLPYSSFR